MPSHLERESSAGMEREPLLGAQRSSAPIVNGKRASPEVNNLSSESGIVSTLREGRSNLPNYDSWRGPPPGGQVFSDDGTDSVVVITGQTGQTAVYPIRWYLLFLLSMNGFTQGLIWNTFGPISETCKIVFDWTNSDIALLANWGCISFFLALFPFNYVIENWGLRASLLLALFGTFFGTSVRLLPIANHSVRYTMHLGQFLAGLGGPVSMAVPPIFSATWFPPHQRTTATAIGALLNLLGIALSFFVGPAFVAEVPFSNVTDGWTFVMNGDFNNVTNATDITPYYNDIYNLMWFGWASIFVLLVMACIYFPNKPPLPPSLSAAQPKGSLLTGLLSIVKVPNFWLVALPYGICAGCFSTYGTQLNSIFKSFGLTQNTAGDLGLIYSCAGIAASFVMAFTADKFAGHFKLFLLTLTVVMTGFFAWICLMYIGVLPFSLLYLQIAFVIYAVCQTSTIPLFYEATIEAVYPISDSIASCMLTLINNIFGAIYLLIMGIQGVGVSWANWAMLGVTAIGIPMLILFKPSYNRLDMDHTASTGHSSGNPSTLNNSCNSSSYASVHASES